MAIVLENVHNVEFKLGLDRKCYKGSDWNDKYPEYPVKISVKHPKDSRARIVGEALPKKIKMHEIEFKRALTKGRNGVLGEFTNTLVKYNNAANKLELWSLKDFKRLLNDDQALVMNSDFKYWYNQKLRAVSSTSESNINKYLSLMTFLIDFHGRVPSFDEINGEFLRRFEKWYLEPVEGKKPKTTAGLNNHIKCLRGVFTYAKDHNAIKEEDYPFNSNNKDKYTIRKDTKRKHRSPYFVVEAISKAELSGSQEKSRDYYMMIFMLGGMNIGDLLAMRWEQYDKNRGVITYQRQKNFAKDVEITIEAPVTDKTAILIDKYCQEYKQGGLILPDYERFEEVTNVDVKKKKRVIERNHISFKMSKLAKEIAKSIDYPRWKEVKSYDSRHAFSTMARDKFGWSIEVIQKFLGHATARMTETYIGELSETALDDYKSKFNDLTA